MKFLLSRFGWFTVVVFLIAGCSRPPVSSPKDNVKVGEKDKVRGERDPLAAFSELGRYPENPRVSDDWTRLRDGLPLLTSHFGKPDVVTRVKLTSEERKFLEGHANLNEAEMAEVESQSFRAADAHYLDECYLLRAAARAVEAPSLDPVEQAHLHFRWVMRNILLHEQVDSWIPPAFTLRRGHAGALDRALVFLALMRHPIQIDGRARGEGCLIVVPDTEPLQFLVAVHDTKDKDGKDKNAKDRSLRLFDPRLELAVPGKDGKSIATLNEVMADPTLLAPSGFTAEQVKKLEAWLVCPLYALSPRMLELQKGLLSRDPVLLHLSAEKLHRDISAHAKIPVKVWNPQAKDKTPPPNSPTRALRLFLSKQEGGIDETNRALAIAVAHVPFYDAVANYARVNIYDEVLPKSTWQRLQGETERLFLNYDLHTRELYLRGQHEALRRRQERLLPFARTDTLVGLADDPKVVEELVKWLNKLREENAKLPGNQAEQMLQAMWTQDEFLDMLADVEKEMKIDPRTGRPVRDLLFEVTTKLDPKTGQNVTEMKIRVTTRIIAIGLRDYLHFELARSQAFVNHENAEHLQAKLRATGKPGPAAQARADEAWLLAKSAWGNFYVERIALEHTIEQRLARLKQRGPSERIDTLGQRIHLLETLHLDVHKYFQARLRHAECLPHVGNDGAKNAHAYLERTKQEIEDMHKKGLLHAEIKKLSEDVRQAGRTPLQKRLDLLAKDWTERGNYYWIQRQIDLRLKALAG